VTTYYWFLRRSIIDVTLLSTIYNLSRRQCYENITTLVLLINLYSLYPINLLLMLLIMLRKFNFFFFIL
jgi:hypothetical protein